jgi:hypothetical protein
MLSLEVIFLLPKFSSQRGSERNIFLEVFENTIFIECCTLKNPNFLRFVKYQTGTKIAKSTQVRSPIQHTH